jgi:PadR family transcriptional regulator PadR
VTDSLLVQLRKGVLDLCVLAMLERSDGYAYDIASRLADASGPPRKYYQLTKAGHAALAAQKAEWNVFTASVAKVLADARVAAPAAKIIGGVK